MWISYRFRIETANSIRSRYENNTKSTWIRIEIAKSIRKPYENDTKAIRKTRIHTHCVQIDTESIRNQYELYMKTFKFYKNGKP